MTNRIVDHSGLRTNQALIIAFLLIGFIFNLPGLVTFVAAVMLIGTAVPKFALFKAVYLYGLKPRGIVKPDPRPDNPEPHQFAQLVGGLFLAASTIAFILGAAILAWALAWVVIALAALNLLAGVCVGCMMYYWFNRLGVPGFTHARVRERS